VVDIDQKVVDMKYMTKPQEVEVIQFNPNVRYDGVVLTEDDLRNPVNKNAMKADNAQTYHIANRLLNTFKKYGAVNIAKKGLEASWTLVEAGDFVVKNPDGSFDVYKEKVFPQLFTKIGE
jgi:hypothetical protein